MKFFTFAFALATSMMAVSSMQAEETDLARTNSIMRVAAPQKTSLKFDVSVSDIVYDTPAGAKSMKSKSGKYYGNSLWGILEGESNGIPCVVVEGDDTFWIYNPYTSLDTKTWLKGDIEGDKVTFKLPQAIYADSDGVNDYVYVAQMCYFQWTSDSHEEGLYYPYEGNTEMVFLKEDGKWVMQQPEEVNEHPVIMAVVAADDGTWCAYSEWNTVIENFSEETVNVPSGLQIEPWALTSLNREYDAYNAGMLVNVGIEGNDIYMQGLSSVMPDAWIKGSIENDKVIFPSRQYLGADEMANMFGFFFGAKEEEAYNEEWGFSYFETTLTESLVFDYDADAKTLRTDGTIVINRGDKGVSTSAMFSAPHIRVQGTVENFTPADPIVSLYSPMGDYAGSLYFAFPNVNTEGQLLDTDNLYYRVYVDGYPFMFYTDEYQGLPEDTEEIPFNFSNLSTIGYFGTFNTSHFFSIMFDGYDSMDIQTLYRNENNEVWGSAIVPVVGSSRIDSATVAGDITSVEWIDIQGRRVNNPDKGIYVKRTTYSDGNVKIEKVAL